VPTLSRISWKMRQHAAGRALLFMLLGWLSWHLFAEGND
jgi:hypothetical protein